ncbi:hypothetical protein [Paenibacillus sp. SI8]|uniref:hypothetical protein n=1 Tax=unclassified Paenibacillus TaxID=185978 RepID=UPI0034651767
MTAVSSASGVSRVKDGIVKPIHGGIHDANEVIWRDVFLEIHWQDKFEKRPSLSHIISWLLRQPPRQTDLLNGYSEIKRPFKQRFIY